MRFTKVLSVCFVLVFVGGVQANVNWGASPTGNALEGVMLVDGGAPLPPPLLTPDGGASLPPPSLIADGGAPLPPPAKYSVGFGTTV